jgi:ADP-ribose pyrophosphatase
VVKSGRSVFKGKILLDVRVGKLTLPNGNAVTIESIKHPGAACIVPFLSKYKIIMIRQYRPVVDEYIWEIPAGTLKKGERPLQCAKRELVEETGYSAGRIRLAGFIYTTPGFTNEGIYIYRAESLKKEDIAPEDDEVLSAKALSITEIRKMFKSRRIIDAKTIAGLAMCGVI